ncbi:MAG TPA: acyl-CoA dehydrogenase family protein [Thermodesulfobacteriota bacterium]
MERFSGVDYYALDALLSDEERLVRDTVRAFVDAEVLPVIEQATREATFPRPLVKKMAELGLFGANLTGYGLPGLSNIAYGLIMQELERGDSGVRSFASVQGALVMYPIHRYGSEAQKARWLPALASGEAIGCFGLTEPDFGSNPGGMRTRARRDGQDWVLNGTKRWITNGSLADVAVVWARADEGILGFLVERGTKGFTTIEMTGKWSLRASVTSELILEDVRVPDSARLPEAQGLRAPLSCLTQARYGIAWGAIGAAMACYHTALEYAKSRVQFERPIAGYQLVQQKLVEMLTGITTSQLLAFRLGQLKDQGRMTPQQVSMAKRHNVAHALWTARAARDILGANGIVDEYPVFRHLANLETVYTYEGTHDIHTLILGQDITGLNAFS